ncbi:MAG: class I SAM-dependent methyltransferase [Parvularculaceae bacterium]
MALSWKTPSWTTPVLGPAAIALWRMDARRKLAWMRESLPGRGLPDQGRTAPARLLEIGSGPGSLVEALRGAGHDIVAIDIANSAYAPDLAPILFDGVTIPFTAGAFDAALLATTLHHAADPDRLIAEAARVAPRVIIIEDIYRSPLQRRLTEIADSLTNLEFAGHPHNNRDDAGWRAAFAREGLRVMRAETKPYAGLFLQALYEVSR